MHALKRRTTLFNTDHIDHLYQDQLKKSVMTQPIASGNTYETLNRFAEVLDLDGIPIHTINLEGLLRTKQTMRDKDVADRMILERALEALRDKVGKA